MAKENHDDLLLYGGLVAAIFIGGKYVLGLFGSSPANKATVTAEDTATPSGNPFSVQFKPFVDNFNANPSTNADGTPMTISQLFQYTKQLYDDKSPALTGKFAQVSNWAETIHTALSPWQLVTDRNSIFGVFDQFTNQTDVSSVAAYFLYNFNQDLLQSLNGSIFRSGLTDDDLATVINKISKLPS